MTQRQCVAKRSKKQAIAQKPPRFVVVSRAFSVADPKAWNQLPASVRRMELCCDFQASLDNYTAYWRVQYIAIIALTLGLISCSTRNIYVPPINITLFSATVHCCKWRYRPTNFHCDCDCMIDYHWVDCPHGKWHGPTQRVSVGDESIESIIERYDTKCLVQFTVTVGSHPPPAKSFPSCFCRWCAISLR